MRTKLKYAVSALLSVILCTVMLCGTVLPIAAKEADLPSLDYSDPKLGSNKAFSVEELYNALLDRAPTEGETLYWQAKKLSLTYNDNIPNSRIDTHYENGKLRVNVFTYQYTAKNGAEVTWVPETIKLETASGGILVEKELEEPKDNVCVVEIDYPYTDQINISVEYSCEIAIAGSIVKALRDDAYNTGVAALEQMKDFEDQQTSYDEKYEQYSKEQAAYEEYIRKKEAYDTYVAAKAQYDKDLAAYEEYLQASAEYEALKTAHELWNQFRQDKETYEDRKKAYQAYEAYLESHNKIVNTLAMFEAVFAKEERGWCMYRDIVGSTVTQVLQRQDELIAAGGNAEDITLAGIATENLRVLLGDYNELRTKKYDSDYLKYKALYEYYQTNYDALKQNFCDLYKTLNGLYKNDAVHGYISLQQKTLHYRQLVGHLFVVSTAFDTSASRDEKEWRIDRKSLEEVIDMDVHYFADGNQWYPSATYPAVEVPFADKVGDELPKEPSVAYPTEDLPEKAPSPVANPGNAPVEPEAPGDPQYQPVHPGPAPQSPVLYFDDITKELYKEVKEGKLSACNDPVPEFVPLKPETVTITKPVSTKNEKTVEYYDAYGNCTSVSVNYGETFKCQPMERDTTDEYFYDFLGWQDSDGNLYGRTAEIEITKDITLYPRYLETKRTYTVTFIAKNEGGEDQIKTVTREYGTKLDPEQYVKIPPASVAYSYEFSGWQNSDGEAVDEIIVTGDAVYNGYIKRNLRKYTVTWVIDEDDKDEKITEEWEYGKVPVFGGDLSVSSPKYIYQFLGWKDGRNGISSVDQDVTYTAQYRKIPLATCNDTALEIEHSETEITVKATDSVVSVEQAAILAAQKGKTLTVCRDGLFSVSFSEEELQSYINSGAPKLMLSVSQEGNTEVYEFKYLGFGFNASAMPSVDVQFVYSKANGQESLFELQTADGWERLAKDKAVVTGSFKARRVYSYSIVWTTNDHYHCDISQALKKAIEGENVFITAVCDDGYKVVKATVLTADGETVSVSGTSFQMPASAVTVELKVEPITYRVIFTVDGEVWSSAEYGVDDKIVLPDAPVKEAEDGYVYTFAGWGDIPTFVGGTQEELVFEAEFTKAQVISDYETGNNNNVLFGIVLPCVGVAAVLLIAFLIMNRVVRKKGGWKIFGIKFKCRIRVLFDKIKKLFSKKTDADVAKKNADTKPTDNTKTKQTPKK